MFQSAQSYIIFFLDKTRLKFRDEYPSLCLHIYIPAKWLRKEAGLLAVAKVKNGLNVLPTHSYDDIDKFMVRNVPKDYCIVLW